MIKLVSLDLRLNNLNHFENEILHHFVVLSFVDMSQNHIQRVNTSGNHFHRVQEIDVTYDLRGNPLLFLNPLRWSDFNKATFLVDEFAACCFMKGNVTCLPPKARPSYLTCGRILPNLVLRVTVWVVGIVAVSFNLGVIISRIVLEGGNKVQNTLIANLAISDFVMGIGMLILLSADLYYADYFPNFSSRWISGPLCRAAGILSTLSSEASIGFVSLIALDRYLGIRLVFIEVWVVHE